jgi:hypothetical protein
MPKRLRARELLRQKAVWLPPLAIGVVLIGVMTALYIGSAVDPIDHMEGLPVSLVQEDTGSTGPAGLKINLGRSLERGLTGSPEVSKKLAIHVESKSEAEDRMNRGASYATVIVPPDFTNASLQLISVPGLPPSKPGMPTVELLGNQRAGTQGSALAAGVLTPALHEASEALGRRLLKEAPRKDSLTVSALQNPIEVEAGQYNPLPTKAALGLSAFYISLLMMMCGFIGATIINSGLDAVLGFAPQEIGPKWMLNRPALISRFQTLIAKWAIAAVLTGVLTAIVLLVAIGILGMDAPEPLLLWVYGWFCAATVAVGTLALFAVLGLPGQLVALLLFVYFGLASAGGTVPIQALPDAFAAASHLDPLRQILGGVRSILYLGSRTDAGLAEGLYATALGLIFWLGVGVFFTRRYDRAGRDRLDPDLLAYVHESVDEYRASRPT